MPTETTGGPAFPQQVIYGTDGVYREAEAVLPSVGGMTLRDYFAATCAPALLDLCKQDTRLGQTYVSYCAGLSYKMADEMLAARGSHK